MPAALFWLLIIFVLIIALFVVVSFLRRYLRSSDELVGQQAFSLGGLRSMLNSGQITQEEYDRLRNHAIAAAKPAEKPKKPPGRTALPPFTE